MKQSSLGLLGGLSVACVFASLSHAQSINIRFGTPASVPGSTYAAAGLPGAWNSFGVTPPSQRMALVSLQGTPVNARLYQIGNASMLAFDNPLTSGDDGSLMDHMILSTNSPVDGCFWVESLMPGQYEVTMYALTPNNAALLNRVRVDDATPGPVTIGGTWPGQHQSGVTYARFNVATINNRIGLHSGLPSGFIQSGLNAIQLRFLGTCPAPSITSQPSTYQIICPGESTQWSVAAASTTAAAYRWQWKPDGSTTWLDLSNGANSYPGVGWATLTIAGATTNTLTTSQGGINPAADRGFYYLRAVISNACGTTTTVESLLNQRSVCCDGIDFNNDTSLFDPQDIDAFLSMYSEGPCVPASATCNDIDFNNDGSLFDPCDIDAFLRVFSEGPCLAC